MELIFLKRFFNRNHENMRLKVLRYGKQKNVVVDHWLCKSGIVKIIQSFFFIPVQESQRNIFPDEPAQVAFQ